MIKNEYIKINKINEIVKNDIRFNINKIIDILCILYIDSLISDGTKSGILLENNKFIFIETLEEVYLELEKSKNTEVFLTREQYDKLNKVKNSILRCCSNKINCVL